MQIYSLKKIPTKILSNVGGKARGLNLLVNNNFDVPNGFIIYEPNGDYKDVIEMYRQMKLSNVAVRSSATLEDGDDFSSAGQFSTFLNVCGEENLIKAIEDCISSLNNETANNYSKTFLNGEKSNMTVVVMEMVDAVVSGVLFSEDPLDKNKILIESVSGLGENLVSGLKKAKQLKVDKVSESFDIKKDSLLNEQQIKDLILGAVKAEKLFSKPVDMEWSIGNDGKIKWLQVRPITISENTQPTLDEFDYKGDLENNVLTTCNIREMMPGAVTPLNLSTNMYALDWGLRKMIHNVINKKNKLPPYSCFVPFGNHMFMNLTSIYCMNASTFLASKDATDLSICGRVLSDYPDYPKKGNFFNRVRGTILFLKYSMSAKKPKKNIKKIADNLSFSLSSDIKSLYKEVDSKLTYLNQCMFYHYWSSFYSGAQTNMLLVMLDPKNQDDGTLKAQMAGALTEIEGIESVDILKSMRAIVDSILKHNSMATNFNTEDVKNYLLNADEETKTLLDSFMKRHGHRGICEPEMRSKPYAKDLDGFAENIRVLLNNPTKKNTENVKHWQEYADQMLSGVTGFKLKLYKKFMGNARQAVFDREYTKSRYIYILDKFKDAYRTLGEKLCENKILPDSDSIYFLTHKEIGELILGKKSLVKKAIARRRLLPLQQELKFPEVSLCVPKAIEKVDVDVNAKKYFGTPVSRGIVKGKARIVKTVQDANLLQSGEIMISSCTDIGWSPYYGIAGGLITEVGSSLSHGVVVAREYALPTIVNVEGIMQAIKTGDFITLNGDTGTITVKR